MSMKGTTIHIQAWTISNSSLENYTKCRNAILQTRALSRTESQGERETKIALLSQKWEDKASPFGEDAAAAGA